MSADNHTPIPVGSAVNASTVNNPLGQLDSAINTLITAIANLIAGVTSFTQLNLGSATTLVISAGVVTVTKSRHRVDTESSAASDDLDTISGGAAGDVLIIQTVSNARVVTVRHNVGNIWLSGQGNVVLDNQRRSLKLVYDSTVSLWVEEGAQRPELKAQENTAAYGTPYQRIVLPQGVLRNDGSGQASLMTQPRLDVRNYFAVRAANATLEPIGCASPTLSGTPALDNQTDTAYVNIPITNVATTVGGARSTFNLVQRGYDPEFFALVRTDTLITNIRIWVGLFSANPGNVDDLTVGSNQAVAFRYSTVAVDPGWIGVSSDGTTQVNTAKIADIAISTAYLLRLRVSGGIAYFSVNGGAELTLSTNLPAATTNLGYVLHMITTTATAKNFKISRFGCWFN